MIFGLSKIEKILEAIDNPHQSIQAIHIGGTNGKGSTAAMMASILKQEGYRVGLYTSPHLMEFTERIKIDEKQIRKREVAELAGWMRKKIEAAGVAPPFTFFDFTTAMALLYFNWRTVDIAVLEVGLGGRLDSTNVIDPLLSVITNISKDHEDQLGKRIMSIAREKAGIIKKGRPLITAATSPRVARLFSEMCRKKGSPFYQVGRDFRYVHAGERGFHYEGLHRKLWDVRLNLSGPHQIINAATALGAMEVLEELGFVVSTQAMTEGLRKVSWPGGWRWYRPPPGFSWMALIIRRGPGPQGSPGEGVPVQAPHSSGRHPEGQRHPGHPSSPGSSCRSDHPFETSHRTSRSRGAA